MDVSNWILVLTWASIFINVFSVYFLFKFSRKWVAVWLFCGSTFIQFLEAAMQLFKVVEYSIYISIGVGSCAWICLLISLFLITKTYAKLVLQEKQLVTTEEQNIKIS